MIHVLHVFAHTLIARGIVTGAISAALVDLSAFRAWRTWDEAIRYDWRMASWRWAQGAVLGALGAAGYDAVV